MRPLAADQRVATVHARLVHQAHGLPVGVRAVAKGDAVARADWRLCTRPDQDPLDGLMMHLLRFPEELRDAPAVPAGSLDDREIDLAVRLVEQLTLPVDVRELRSERRAALDRLVESKRATVTPPGSSTAADFLIELERVVREMEAAGKGA